jgi:hypothetical protein
VGRRWSGGGWMLLPWLQSNNVSAIGSCIVGGVSVSY